MARTVVTGGNGFIGAHVVKALRAGGHEVAVVDVQGEGEHIDICDVAALERLFTSVKPQVVYHLAGIADARAALRDPVKATQTNVTGTAAVLEAARRANAGRVCVASTCWVANAMGNGILDEAQPFNYDGGDHVYTTTKIATEMLAHDFHHLYGTKFTILRYGIPYGPGMWNGLVLKAFLDNAFAGKPLTIFGDGSATRRFVYVQDLAQAHVLALASAAENQVYNLEGMRFVTIKELAELVQRHVGGVEITYREEPTRIGEFQYFRKILSNHKAYVELGWEPKVEMEEGVRRTIEWYKNEVYPTMKKPVPA